MFAQIYAPSTPIAQRGHPLAAMLRSVHRSARLNDAFSFVTLNRVTITVQRAYTLSQGDHWRIVLHKGAVKSRLIIRHNWLDVTRFLVERGIRWSTLRWVRNYQALLSGRVQTDAAYILIGGRS